MTAGLIRQIGLVRIFSIVLVFAGSIFALPAAAQSIWMCTVQPEDKGVEPVTERFVEENKKTLSAYTDDYTGKPVLYDIVESSDEGIIAVSHYSSKSTSSKNTGMGLITILLNKKTGDFRQYGYLMGTRFEDRYEGNCVLQK
jgi:hypothetical protein